jgi:hypothetical protein
MKHELYLKEQEAVQKKLAESIADNLQKQKTKKEAQYMQLWKEVEVRGCASRLTVIFDMTICSFQNWSY